jgi:hypothetical protein
MMTFHQLPDFCDTIVGVFTINNIEPEQIAFSDTCTYHILSWRLTATSS